MLDRRRLSRLFDSCSKARSAKLTWAALLDLGSLRTYICAPCTSPGPDCVFFDRMQREVSGDERRWTSRSQFRM